MRATLGIPAIIIAMSLSGCSINIGERQLLHPIAGGTLSQQTLTAAASPYTVTDHTITARDGTKLHAIYLTQPASTATILYFGGNGYTIGRFGHLTSKMFSQLKVDLMVVDHRGYGLRLRTH